MAKVLIAEDERVMRFMITDFLQNFDIEVLQAENGLDAYVLWKNENPDLLLTDINMPKMNGIDLLKKVKEKNPDFPVIVMTGVNVDTAKNLAQECHANAILEKPFKMKDLMALIFKLIEI